MQQTNEALVMQYRPFVRKLARRMKKRLTHTVDTDNLEQAGMIGLIESAARFRGDKGASFETFVGHRIKGAMLDAVRESDWAPRSVSRAGREITKAIHDIELKEQRPARETEIADRLGISLDDYHARLVDMATHHIFSFDEAPAGMTAACPSPRPEHVVERERLDLALREAMTSLPEREAMIIERTFFAGATLIEIGTELGITESRVCQLRTQATARLRAKLKDWK